MKISILLPTLNRLRYLMESLTSAREQTYGNLEILVSDDGSTDGSQDYVREIQAVDARVRLTPPNPQPGLFENLNYLVGQSTGDAFCILGDDDRLLPDYIEKLVQPLLKDTSVVASFCDFYLMNNEGAILEEFSRAYSRAYGRADLPEGIMQEPLIPAMNVTMCMGFSLYRSRVFQQEVFDLNCGGAADVDYAIRASQLGKLYYVKEKLGELRFHQASASRSRLAYMIDGLIHVFGKHLFSEEYPEQKRKELLLRNYRVGIMFYCVENRREWWHTLRGYLRHGGRALDAKVLLSFVLAAPPRNIARMAKTSYKSMEQRFL